jgi:putative peptidoglycan lipid II flippase
MNKLLQRANKRMGLGNAAALLVFASMFGQILGFLRTKLVNANFHALGPNSTDAYFAAFNIPDFFFYTIAAGALGVAFIPVLADHLQSGDKKAASELTSSLLNLFAIIMAIVGVLIFVFARPLIHYVVAPGLTPHQLNNTVIIMRFLAFNPLLFTLSGILTSLQQSFGRFFFYAVAPIFYNVCIIFSIFIFRNNIGIVGLGIGALAGAIVQLLIVLTGLKGISFRWSPKIFWGRKDINTVLRNFPARAIDQGIDQIEGVVETHYARSIGTGNISYYNNANILMSAPTLLIGSAISTAVFPRLANRLAQHRPDLFRKDFLMVLRVIIWIVAPVSVISFFCRGYLARLIFANDSSQISVIFGFLTAAIFFTTIYMIISRWFYAQKDTMTPLLVSIFTIILDIILAYKLSRPSSYGVAGLALAQSIVSALEVIILTAIMVKRDHKLLDKIFWGSVLKTVSVTGFSVLTAYIMVSLFPLQISDHGFIVLGTKFTLIAVVTFTIHITISSLFGLDEPKPILSRIKRIILKPIRIEY